MSDQQFTIENGTLTRFESEDFVETVYVPDDVQCIGWRAFYEAAVGTVILSDEVTVIEEEAFLDCSLSQIEIPDSLTTIETWAFGGCEALKRIVIPEHVTSIGPWAIGYRKLLFHPHLDPVPFGQPVTIIGKSGSEAERYAKDNYYRFNEHITEFQEIEPDRN